jgi:TetR/AcrR family transcriptional regulator, ethionamide resistance regulator
MASAQPSTAKRAQVQAAVLQATEDLLAQGGSFADLKIERIAAGAGISRTAFYFYFRDKRELLMRLCEDVTSALYEEADAWFSGDTMTRTEVREALMRVATLYDDHGPLLRAITEVATYDEELAGFWRALLQRFADATSKRIEAEQQAGRAGDMAPAPTAFSLVWMTERTLYEHMVQNGGQDLEALVDAMAGVWTRAVYGVVER